MKRGFTLIELLVVIAIIGILSAIVLASLSTARERGREAAIQSTLKSMSNQIEILRADSSNYQFVTSCASDPSLKKFVDSMLSQGAAVACDSYPTSGTDPYLRWAVTAEMVGASDLTAWSASPQGVVTWDTTDTMLDGTSGSQTMSWDNANKACALNGKRLPTAEQLQSLYMANHPQLGFISGNYWSGTEVPDASDSVYDVTMTNGTVRHDAKHTAIYVRCVG